MEVMHDTRLGNNCIIAPILCCHLLLKEILQPRKPKRPKESDKLPGELGREGRANQILTHNFIFLPNPISHLLVLVLVLLALLHVSPGTLGFGPGLMWAINLNGKRRGYGDHA